MERLVHEEFVDESDYKEEHGVGFCEQILKEEKSKSGSEDSYWVQVHLLTT